MKPKVSVIIPVYNVESHIARCARALFGQTMREGVEFIFVDDCTPDGSIGVAKAVLGEFPGRAGQTRFVRHEHNKGLPSARNTGLGLADGEYVFHCDSDDYMEEDALEKLYGAARENDADIVWCDWHLSMEKSERRMSQPSYDTAMDALRGMLSGAMKFNVWNKLARKRLYEDNLIRFPDGYGLGEDMTMMKLFACAGRVCHLSEALYHYVRTNANAFTSSAADDDRVMANMAALRHNVEEMVRYMRDKFGDSLERELAFFQLDAKFPLLLSGSRRQFELWQSLYAESNAHIMENKGISLRSRLLQWMAARGQFWYVRAYCKIVMGLVYGVLYG